MSNDSLFYLLFGLPLFAKILAFAAVAVISYFSKD